MYSIKVENKEKIKKIKGIKKNIVKKDINFNNFLECLIHNDNKYVEQNLIKSQRHIVTSVVQRKLALISKDDKRYSTQNSYCTLPWGHHKIEL